MKWLKFYTKEITKAIKLIIIALEIILILVLIKYKPAYEVTLSGERLGFVEEIKDVEEEIIKYINDKTGNIAFREETAVREYQFKLINREIDTNKDVVLGKIEDSIITTYRTYAILVDNTVKTSVSTEDEAKILVNDMTKDVEENVNIDVGIIEQYSTDLVYQTKDEANGVLCEIKNAKIEEYHIAKAEQERIAAEEERKRLAAKSAQIKVYASAGTIEGINLSQPVSGTISSRFGSRSSSRSTAHTGLDIASPHGTSVVAIAGGTVTFAGYKGSYGNLVIINHGNGIESYYAHCSEIYVSVGQTVSQNSVISAVGSTGNSTGAHLHLEIRQNGVALNPEQYIY